MTEYEIRHAIPSDIEFIYSTMLNSYRSDSDVGKSTKKSVYFTEYRQILDDILDRSTTFVACKSDDPSIIFGYLIFEGIHTLHYSFVKEAFRGFGIYIALLAKAFQDHPQVIFTHKTHAFERMLKDMVNPDKYVYIPFKLYQKKEMLPFNKT